MKPKNYNDMIEYAKKVFNKIPEFNNKYGIFEIDETITEEMLLNGINIDQFNSVYINMNDTKGKVKIINLKKIEVYWFGSKKTELMTFTQFKDYLKSKLFYIENE